MLLVWKIKIIKIMIVQKCNDRIQLKAFYTDRPSDTVVMSQ